ncbi:hypothetical protein [Stenotrophomonas maltophilia]
MLAELQLAFQTLKVGTDLLSAIRNSDKALSEADLKLKLAELMGHLADARVAVIEASERLSEKDQEIERLALALQNKEQVVKERDAYYPMSPEGKAIGAPYCMRCFEVDHFLVHLVRPGRGDTKSSCPKCKVPYDRRMTPTLRADGCEE